jgi:hypothetical protein
MLLHLGDTERDVGWIRIGKTFGGVYNEPGDAVLVKSPITKRQQVILVIRAASLEIVPSL